MTNWTELPENVDIERLWGTAEGLIPRVCFFTGGEPVEYRTIPTRWPLPAGELGALYGVTLSVNAQSFEVGTHSRWKARPPKATTEGQAYLAQEQYGYDPGDFVSSNIPAPIIGHAADYWRAGQLQPAHLPRTLNLALTTESIYFEPFDTADLTNYKVTTEPTFASAETTLPASSKFSTEVYAMLVPQWWRFTIGWDGYAVDNPDAAVTPSQKRLRPLPIILATPVIDAAGNVEPPPIIYRYWMTYTTAAAGESWPSLMSNDVQTATGVGSVDPGQILISFPPAPDGITERTLYRAEVADSDPTELGLGFVGAAAKLVVVITDPATEEYQDNFATASLGALCPRFYPLPFGNSIGGDYFWIGADVEDWATGSAVTRAAGFWWCDNAPGDVWADWQFCAATGDPPAPPDPACFPCATLRGPGVAQVTRSFEITGFKQALIRPVFPAESAQYSDGAFNPSWESVLSFVAGEPDEGGDEVDFDCGGANWTEAAASYTTAHYESLLIPSAGATAEQIRVLCAWAENSHSYNAYFAGDPSPYDLVLQGAGAGVQAAYWTANGKLTVTRSDTPAESLVAAISIDGERRYVWRKTATTGRSAAIVTDAAYDSIEHRYSVSSFTGTEPQINRRFIRSAGTSPPS